MNDSSIVGHRSQTPKPEPIQPELNEPIKLSVAVERSQEASAVAIYSKGFDSSLIDEIRKEIKNGDGSTFFFDSENEMFPESFSEDYLDFLHSYE
ncbi:hypothetical protein C7H19_24705 [Aphanothece hegewaldii CCALA 016]|uniref:Uncharacterized protein n=1 Tax=Aphanothece hegewaldii CCALA 016 TaxID=2107694 RepID=A0A2T1LQJ2_9CHRO|nr:hypothetical protein [Aphanothece hegewaldii]PSF28492.1 hypothetical protein C7H19_24705 [Aphanothece hegewaldii CCALA 016]